MGVATTVSNQLTFTSGLLDASNYSLNLTAGNKAVLGASAASYIVTGNGISSTGQLNINNVSANTSTTLPIGTSTYYLPATINPGANSGNSYAAFAFSGATTNALANGTSFTAGTLSKMLNVEWNIARTAGSGNASLSLNWASSGTSLEGSAFQGYGLNIGISQYTGGTWQTGTGTGNVSTQTASSTFSSFSQFSVVGNGVILRDLLIDFEVHTVSNNTVSLLWSVSDLDNIKEFEIEKSTDRSDWEPMGSIRISDRNSEAKSFSFTDNAPVSGENYYRIGIRNPDGRKIYSQIKSANLSITLAVNVYPNPASDFITIHVDDKYFPYSVRLLNPEGRLLSTLENRTSAKISFDVKNYPTGLYVIQVITSKAVLKSAILAITH